MVHITNPSKSVVITKQKLFLALSIDTIAYSKWKKYIFTDTLQNVQTFQDTIITIFTKFLDQTVVSSGLCGDDVDDVDVDGEDDG